MEEKDLDIKIVEDYIIIKNIKRNDKIVLDEDDFKEMMMEHFQLKDNIEYIIIELNELGKLLKN